MAPQRKRASFSYRVLRAYEFNGWEIVSRALVEEVTILSPSRKPVEPSTEVLLLERAPAATTPPVSEVSYGDGSVIRRNVGQVLGIR